MGLSLAAAAAVALALFLLGALSVLGRGRGGAAPAAPARMRSLVVEEAAILHAAPSRNPVAQARAESAAAIGRVQSDTRKRGWWLYVKLSTLEMCAKSAEELDSHYAAAMADPEVKKKPPAPEHPYPDAQRSAVLETIVARMERRDDDGLRQIAARGLAGGHYRPARMTRTMRVRALFDSSVATKFHAHEERKALARAALTRAFYRDSLVRGTAPTKGRRGEYAPPPRTADPDTAPVREGEPSPSGDVMLAVWCGPEDESPGRNPPELW
jgi:hypothetical protein